jgi:CysZ protein
MIDDLRSGPACLLEGFRLLARPGLRRYVLLPALGNFVLFALAALLVFWALDGAVERWLPEQGWLRWLLFPLAAAALLLGSLFAFTVVANLLLGPFLGQLAGAVNAHVGGARPAAGQGWWRDFREDIGQELRRLGYILLCFLGVFVLGWVPLLNLLVAPVGLLVTAWMLALEHAAHPLGLRRLPLREQLGFLRRHRLAVLGFGLTSMGVLLVPVLNLLLLPAAVAGMTLFVHLRRASLPGGE